MKSVILNINSINQKFQMMKSLMESKGLLQMTSNLKQMKLYNIIKINMMLKELLEYQKQI
jgi:hypothetical protein